MSCASCGSADAGRCHTTPRLPVWCEVMWALLSSISTSDWWCGWRAAGFNMASVPWRALLRHMGLYLELPKRADFICVMMFMRGEWSRIRSGDAELMSWWGERRWPPPFFYLGDLRGSYLLLCILKDDSAVGAQMSLSTVRTFSSALFSWSSSVKQRWGSGHSEVKVSADSLLK